MCAGKTRKGDCTIDGERARIDFGSLEGDMICGLFHTHTPLTYVSEGHSRETGPSDEANLNLRWPEFVYDYSDSIIHSGHPLNLPGKIYEYGPDRRASKVIIGS